MLCDKADCNYYDSSMEYNCAWGNDGSSSIMCMTHDYKRYCQRPLTSKSGYVSGVNYKQLYESEKHLRELSEARFRAAEEVINHVPYKDSNIRNVFLVGMDEAVDKWLTLKNEAGE